MIHAADDFEAIRARRDELCREQDAVIGGEPDPLPAEWLTPEAAERRRCHQRFTAQQTDELAKLLGHPALADPFAPGALVDECQDWADKVAALASYARQAEDEALRKMATRIRAQAILRCGELLREIEPAKPDQN
jgi:hypothetical protein